MKKKEILLLSEPERFNNATKVWYIESSKV
jgi:hypothetical protein